MTNRAGLEHQADLSGGVILPALAGAIYGAAYLVGHWHEPKSLPVALILGGLTSIIFAQTTYWIFFLAPPGRSWRGALAGFGTLIPYFYSLALMGYLGLWRLWSDVAHYQGILPVIAALFWILVGWRMLFVLGKITRRSPARPEINDPPDTEARSA